MSTCEMFSSSIMPLHSFSQTFSTKKKNMHRLFFHHKPVIPRVHWKIQWR